MEHQSPEKPAMRFLSFSNDQEDADKEAKLKEAAAKIERAIARERALGELVDCPAAGRQEEETIDLQNDVRSLYERLQEQRNKKKALIEEAQKLSNFVSHLDEDDANYLNEVAKNRREEELRKRLEVQDALEAKRRLDKQKMLDEEKRKRESLLGVGGKDMKSSKSRLSSMIKVKTKRKDQSDVNKTDGSQDSVSSPGLSSSINRPTDALDKSSARPAGKQLTLDPTNCATDDPKDHQNLGIDERPKISIKKELECGRAKDVAQVLGVMPSSLIVRANLENSDDSEDSDDDTNCNLIPRGRKRQRS